MCFSIFFQVVINASLYKDFNARPVSGEKNNDRLIGDTAQAKIYVFDKA